MFRSRYPILEIESIPRDKAVLLAKIIDSRKQLRRRNLTRFAAMVMVFVACVIMFVWMPARRPAAHASNIGYSIYLPAVHHE